MSGEPRLFRVDRTSWTLGGVKEVNFADLDVTERADIQEWVAANPSILGEDLLIIAKEYSGFDRTRERPDLLAVDRDGRLVVVELKRDDSGTDVHWQAIKYASYLRDASAEDIIEMLARHRKIEEEDAAQRLSEHVGADDDVANVLNNDQRVMLVSHRFPAEVTSAALWLNEKAARPLITCVTLIPYSGADDALHILASTIIPIPGEAGYKIGIGTSDGTELQRRSDLRPRNRQDGMSTFLQGVAAAVKEGVQCEVPDKASRWAGGHPGWRYYHLWYARYPWRNWSPAFRIEMYPESEEYPAQLEEEWTAWVGFVQGTADHIRLDEVDLDPNQELRDGGIWVQFEACKLTEALAARIAKVLTKFVDTIAPIVNDPGNESE